MASIKVARAGTSGNMVYAGVSADGYDVADGMTAVSWDPQMFATAGSNDNDIVNLNVDATVSGATVTTDFGGGGALAGWAISVTSGGEAVEGAPEMLDDDGNAAFTTTVGADDLPATFTIALAEDQDLAGGESFSADAIEYTHDGLSLAGTMDAGMFEVSYSTQTLMVYVHHERDQVKGYTGNILGGDVRDGKGEERMADVVIRYIDGSGRSRAFDDEDGIVTPKNNGDGGVWTFSNVPADANVIVQADEAVGAEGVMILDESGHSDELAAYTGVEDNGITGGAFGTNGGFSHTVKLCPLQAVDPTSQDHDECASFAYVSLHTVNGQVWKNGVFKSNEHANDDEFLIGEDEKGVVTYVPGTTVGLSPVTGKNLAGDEESHTTTEKPVRTAGETSAGTEVLDETHQFAFINIASGVYKLDIPSGWRAKLGEMGTETALGDALDPLGGPVEIDVTPKTAVVYGYVRDSEQFPVEGVTVTANGVAATSDVHGRYIAEGVKTGSHDTNGDGKKESDKVLVATTHTGNEATRDFGDFGANTIIRQDVKLGGVGKTASISGTVRASGTNAPIAGATVEVSYDKGATFGAPENKATSGANKGKLVTGTDGTYTATVKAQDVGESVDVRVTKDGMSFVPASIAAPAHAGADVSGIDFTGFLHATITGRVKGPDGMALGDVTVTATSVQTGGPTLDPIMSTSNARGTFVLSVPFGVYDIEAKRTNYTFKYPNDNKRVNVAPGQTLNYGDIDAETFMASGVKAMRLTDTDTTSTPHVTTYSGTILVTWTGNAGDVPAGYDSATYTVETDDGSGWQNANATVVADSSLARFTNVMDGEFMVRVVATAGHDTEDDLVLNSDPDTVAAVDPSASGVTAARDTANADQITVSWDATTNDRSNFRIVVQFSDGVWYVASEDGRTDGGENIGSELKIHSVREWTLSGPVGDKISLTSRDGTGTKVALAELAKEFKIAVESVQGDATADDGDNPWQRSNVVTIEAKPADDNGG